MKLFAGTSGYSYKEWKGTFYPKDVPQAGWLAYYAERLDAVEINNTFYRMPKSAVVQKWASEVPSGFQFVLKASQRITHRARLKDVEETLEFLWRAARHLGEHRGPVLFQLPPYLKKDLERLQRFLDLVPEDIRIVLEFRHASWFEDDVFEALRARDVAVCLGDDVEETLPLISTADWGYLRMRRAGYTDPELEDWAGRVRAQNPATASHSVFLLSCLPKPFFWLHVQPARRTRGRDG